MAVSVEEFDHLKKMIRTDLDLDSDTFKVALVSSSYTFDSTDTQWADMSANEISGTGYTAGGETLTSVTVSAAGVFDAADTVWSTATITMRRAILYASGTFGSLTNPVMISYLLDDTPADVVVSAADFTLVWNASGIII
jgi:hypothetical protein